MARIVVIGAGVGGLGAAIGLADRGHDVLVVERDAPPSTTDGDKAFEEWDRPHVPQFRHAHAFSARSRNLLAQHAPAVLDRLRDDGIEEVNFFKLLAPPELHRPEDDEFTGLLSRRPAFELALRLTAAAHPRVEIRCPARVTGLLHQKPGHQEPGHQEPGHQRPGHDESGDESPAVRITGVRVDDLAEPADLVIDAGGRRSATGRWLRDLGIEVGEDVQDCGITYHTRYYRHAESSTLSTLIIQGLRAQLDSVFVMGFIGDHRTYAIIIATPSWDDELRVLRHNWAYEATVAAIPLAAPWGLPENGTPLHDVDTMAGHQNVRRHWIVDGEPVVLGLLPVGDALCTTNPAYGWGASMALTYAFAAVDAIAAGGDARAITLRYHDAVRDEAHGVYKESAAMDRTRGYRWRSDPVPEHDIAEAERQSLIAEGVMQGARRDPVLGRAFLRRMNLLDAPHAILDDPDVARRAREMRDFYASRPPRSVRPDRAELLAIIEGARPTAASAASSAGYQGRSPVVQR
jgi:2-polyprenyl-6-methoxyphenol hydroxylase-like FAD-dependent oxidoreductase